MDVHLRSEEGRPTPGSSSSSVFPSGAREYTQPPMRRSFSSGTAETITWMGSPRCRERCWLAIRLTTALATILALVILFLSRRPETQRKLIEYGSVPVVAAIVGWGTNAVAIHMTFYPLEYVGCCPRIQVFGMPLCGWIGIIPANCTKMATQAVELMTTRLLDVGSTFSRLDLSKVATDLRPYIEKTVPMIVEKVVPKYAPRTWGNMPHVTRRELVKKCVDDSQQAITNMMASPSTDITQVFNLTDMLVEMLTRDKQLVNEIFESCAADEFKFIKVSGFYLGFLFGLVQMDIWCYFPKWWVLPVAGFVVGYLTNWVALKIIFQPVEPKMICGYKIQGLFLKRQPEVAKTYAKLLSERVLNAENLMLGITTGACSEKVFEALDISIQRGIERMVPAKRLVKGIIGVQEYTEMKAEVSRLIKDEIRTASFLPNITPYINEALNVQETLENSMLGLSTQEFEDMLHPVFQEGELKLVLIGGVLGVLVGMAQAVLQVPDQLGLPNWL